jgi:hypothetical protein
VKADSTDTQGGRPLQLLGEAGTRPSRLGFILGGSVEHIGRVHHDVLRSNLGALKGRAEPLHAIGTHGGFVAVVLGRRGKDLQSAHTRISGAQRRHADTAIRHRMGTEELRHFELLLEVPGVMVRTDPMLPKTHCVFQPEAGT